MQLFPWRVAVGRIFAKDLPGAFPALASKFNLHIEAVWPSWEPGCRLHVILLATLDISSWLGDMIFNLQ